MNKAETNTLHVTKNGLTDAEWNWLVNNWEGLLKSGKHILKQKLVADGYPPNVEASQLIEINIDMFDADEDYLEFRKIDEEVIEEVVMNWFYDIYSANNH